jgi:hypothetical protein
LQEPAAHAGRRARRREHAQLELSRRDRCQRSCVQGDAKFDALRQLRRGTVVDDERVHDLVGQNDLFVAIDHGLLDEREQGGVALGQHAPHGPGPLAAQVAVRVAESGIRDQFPDRH